MSHPRIPLAGRRSTWLVCAFLACVLPIGATVYTVRQLHGIYQSLHPSSGGELGSWQMVHRDLVIETSGGSLECTACTPRSFNDIDEAAGHLNEMLGEPCLAKMGLTVIVPCGSLTLAGKKLGGLTSSDGRVVYIQVGFGLMMAWTVLHESMHVMDMSKSRKHDQAAWQSCNPPGFVYGGDCDEGAIDLDFVSAYACHNIREDRAETFKWLAGSSSKLPRSPAIECKRRLLCADLDIDCAAELICDDAR